MQDRVSCSIPVRALVTLSGALAGLMLATLGSMIYSGVLLPIPSYPLQVLDLHISWQVPSILFCALLCGPRSGVIASIAYLIIGIFYLPIFQNGGSIEYLKDPGFGYLIGFIPAVWVSGRLAEQKGMYTVKQLTLAASIGLLIIQICGIIYISFGKLIDAWQEHIIELIYGYSLAPLPSQLLMCPTIALIAIIFRRLIFKNEK